MQSIVFTASLSLRNNKVNKGLNCAGTRLLKHHGAGLTSTGGCCRPDHIHVERMMVLAIQHSHLPAKPTPAGAAVSSWLTQTTVSCSRAHACHSGYTGSACRHATCVYARHERESVGMLTRHMKHRDGVSVHSPVPCTQPHLP